MKIKVEDVLGLSDNELKNCKIELNMTEGRCGTSYIDKWIKLLDEQKLSGLTNCSYWGWYGKQRNFQVGQIVLSFLRMNYDEWLLISAAKIIDVPKDSRAQVEIIDKYKPFFGRLIMKYKKDNTYGRYVFNALKILQTAYVKEILPCMYNGERFEGYDKVHLEYEKLNDIFNGRIMPTYFEALKKITGIYCLTDIHTGKLYIGSATGVEGVAERWGNYLSSKHGGNKRLIELYKEKGEEYFEKYFTFTLLEYFGLSYDPQRILEREEYWKICLDTRRNGYNDN